VDKKREKVDVDTGWKVVDVMMPAGSSDVHVVLADATGRIQSRDASADRSNPTNTKLFEESRKVETDAIPAPTPPTGTTGGPGRGTPGRNPTPQPTPTPTPGGVWVDPRAGRMNR